MSRRTVLFVAGLLVLSAIVIYLVAFVLPQQRIHGLWPLPTMRVDPRAGLPPVLGRALATPPETRLRPSIFWLRPFGLHREGIAGVWWYLGSFLAMFIPAAVALLLLPRRVRTVADVLSNGWSQRLLAFTIGLMGYLTAGILVFLIFINVVGWPLLLVIALTVYAATAIGLVAIALALGAGASGLVRLHGRGPLFHLWVGAVLLFLASILPYLGWIVAGVAAALGFGAVLWTRGGDEKGWTAAVQEAGYRERDM